MNSTLFPPTTSKLAQSTKGEKRAQHQTKTLTLPVSGMTCVGCASTVERAIKKVPGVDTATVNFANESALIAYDPEVASPAKVRKAVQDSGYDLIMAQDDNPDDRRADEDQVMKRKTFAALAFAVPVVLLGMTMSTAYSIWIQMFLAAPVVFWFGGSFFRNALKQARNRQANMDTLVAISTGVAFLYSAWNTIYAAVFSKPQGPVYFESAAVVITFILLGKLLERRARTRTSEAIRKLAKLQPTTIRVRRADGEHEINISQVVTGDVVIVRPGERLAVDGSVADGHTFIDESMLTGEPMPVEKSAGAKVYSGTINQRGNISITTEKAGDTTLLAQIVRRVQEAQSSKAPVEKLVDKVAGIFVPVVLAIAVATLAVWLIAGGTLAQAVLASVTVLIIACPCALGLATPTAIIASMGRAASMGILIRDASSLEVAGTVNTVVFDKTGTITEGRPEVTKLVWIQGDQYAPILKSLEDLSEHPLAAAVVGFLAQAPSVPITQFESITGRGVRGLADDTQYFVGSHHMLDEAGIALPNLKEFNSNSTLLYFFSKTQLLAVIAVADRIKEGSVAAIARLRSMGIQPVMLTGDSKGTATSVADAVGIEEFSSDLLPNQKGEYLKKLQADGRLVAMVGDGINDSEALAIANVGIAMGKGTDIAMEVAEMTILSSNLARIPDAILLSRDTVRTIRQNLFWAFVYNVIGIPIAAGVLYPFTGYMLSPMIAGAAMALSSVSVVTNSLRLSRKRR